MRYTVPIVVEKALALLDVEPLAVHYADHCDVNGFSPNYRERGRQDLLWLQDNASGAHPYAACGARHCVYIPSRAEEAGELPACEGDRSLIVLPRTVTLRRLVTVMEACFAFYNDWGDALLDVLRRGGDWFALLEVGHRALENPMIIYSRSMRILAYTASDGTSDAMWTDTIREGVARVDSQRQGEELMRFLAEVERHDAPFRHQGEGMSAPFWSAPVLVDGRRRGMVNVVEAHRPLGRGDRDLLCYFAEFVAIRMAAAGFGAPVPDAVPRQLMLDLLAGDIASHDRLNSRLIAVGWRTGEWFRFVSLRAALPVLAGEQWSSAYDRLAALSLNGLSCLDDRDRTRICLLLTGDSPEAFGRPLELLGPFCAMNHLRAGVSEPFRDLLQTPRYHRQAEAALALEAGSVCDYTAARYARMLRHLRAHPYREDLVHPAMARLAALDRTEGAEYIPTLRALIQHTFNQMETANALGIHRTTLAYRLRRAQELTGLDLTDAKQVFHVAVSLELMEG
ncbi:MAG: helix-turn-helix domain-containing protein [Clostridia bacterium]|nr:helix-turn-helix domain-containing protein [Clostridia bacterium]